VPKSGRQADDRVAIDSGGVGACVGGGGGFGGLRLSGTRGVCGYGAGRRCLCEGMSWGGGGSSFIGQGTKAVDPRESVGIASIGADVWSGGGEVGGVGSATERVL